MALRIKSKPVQHEGEITAANIIKLKQRPVQGNFDADHLREINRRVLEGIPSYGGGEYRLSTGEHVRSRSVNNGRDQYVVHYKEGGVKDQDINNAIKKLGPINELKNLPKDEFTRRISTLYGDLDHIHAFNEANSRSLRVFTEQISKEAGYKLDWPRTNLNKEARDELYKARDMEVSKRSHPNLTIEKMRYASSSEIEAYETQKRLQNAKPLEQVFKENITRVNQRDLTANPYQAGKASAQKTQVNNPQQTKQKVQQQSTEKTISRGRK